MLNHFLLTNIEWVMLLRGDQFNKELGSTEDEGRAAVCLEAELDCGALEVPQAASHSYTFNAMKTTT